MVICKIAKSVRCVVVVSLVSWFNVLFSMLFSFLVSWFNVLFSMLFSILAATCSIMFFSSFMLIATKWILFFAPHCIVLVY